ncbi:MULTISPECIES: MerR family transcriptional regulator [Nitrospirillum]|uniref:DNA-binding transcriptional MerR regulator n=1 Tax=Nitrospirillum amazonense TaxID=28077 RepID=A0A560F5H9_9PROT|nr:MerR family DNA-binding transcriptional regulator [Nitrospirillum amazonense]MEC4590499.1 MerR family DNA-binding transcriptional regulator [Nitrospirillum amazonense]TWB16868.1 DNA-binding transcriptional MerR regulator [Nitrospirillum amazonense]TWB21053.1 DNA-binding transcriptional MerR regulator [Nitrospirillum amazonense]TWB52731.1 DNA-binding transcriptional MerR regulator [Nitrospirillum amazonense]
MPDGAPVTAVEETYTISQLAEAFELTPRTIRYYEDEGLLTPRREGQQRVYTHRDWARLKLIMRGKRLGFTIAGIKDFLDLYEVGDAQVPQMRFLLSSARDRIATLEQQLRDVQQTLVDLKEIEGLVVDHLARKGALDA